MAFRSSGVRNLLTLLGDWTLLGNWGVPWGCTLFGEPCTLWVREGREPFVKVTIPEAFDEEALDAVDTFGAVGVEATAAYVVFGFVPVADDVVRSPGAVGR